MIEVEKEKSDQQSVLRWTMVGVSDNRKSRTEVAERMQTREEKRALNRKLQRESFLLSALFSSRKRQKTD